MAPARRQDELERPRSRVRAERSTPPLRWAHFAILRTRLPTLAERLAQALREGLGRAPRVEIRIDGFEGAFEGPEGARELLERVTERDWRAARHFTIGLRDDRAQNPLQVVFKAARGRGATLTIRGDRGLTRNGLRPELESAVQSVLDEEARRRREEHARKRDRLWLAAGAIAAIVGAAAALWALHL